MSKLKNIPNIMPFSQNNFLATKNMLPSVKLTRSSPAIDVFKNYKVSPTDTPIATDQGIYLCQSLTNLHTNNRPSTLSGWGLHYANFGISSTGIKTLDGQDAYVVKRGVSDVNATNATFIASPIAQRALNSRYLVGAVVKPLGRIKDNGNIYLRWVGKASGGIFYLPTVRYNVATKVWNIAPVADYDVRGGVVELQDGWLYIWLTTNTPAGTTDQSGVSTEIGAFIDNVVPNNGEELMCVDLLQYQATNSFTLPSVSSSGAQTTFGNDIVYSEKPLLDGNSFYIEFNEEDYYRTMSFNGALVNIGADTTDLMLVRDGNTIKQYSGGAHIGDIAFTNNSNLNFSMISGSMYLKRCAHYSTKFDDDSVPLITLRSPGIAHAMSKVLNTIKTVVAGSNKNVIRLIQEATAIYLDELELEVVTANPYYLELGATTVLRLQAKKSSKRWSGSVDIMIKGYRSNGIGYWDVSLAGGRSLGTTLNTPILRLMGTHVAGLNSASVNSYHYDLFNNVTQHRVTSGDVLEYEIYYPQDGTAASLDCTVDGLADPRLRHTTVVDQNGRRIHPAADLQDLATRQWFHRKLSLNPIVGTLMRDWAIALENEGNRTTTVYLRNVVIRNAAGNVVSEVFTNTLYVPQSVVWALGGSVNYKDVLKAVLSPSEAIGIVPLV